MSQTSEHDTTWSDRDSTAKSSKISRIIYWRELSSLNTVSGQRELPLRGLVKWYLTLSSPHTSFVNTVALVWRQVGEGLWPILIVVSYSSVLSRKNLLTGIMNYVMEKQHKLPIENMIIFADYDSRSARTWAKSMFETLRKRSANFRVSPHYYLLAQKNCTRLSLQFSVNQAWTTKS